MTISPHHAKPVGLGAGALALLITVLWGGNVVSIKFGLDTFPPMWSSFWRFVCALPVLWLWTRFLRVPITPDREVRKPLFLLSLLFFAQLALLNLGLNYTSAAYAIVLLNANPIFTNLLAHYLVPGDHLSRAKIAGLTIAFAGVGLAFLGEPEARLASHPLWGNVICLATALLIGVRMIYTKRLVVRAEPVMVIFWQVAVAIPLFFIAGWLFEPATRQPISWPAAAAILYQGIVVAGGCFIAWVFLLRRHPPGVLSVFAFPTPLFGVLFSALVFGERIAPELVFGGLSVALGIYLVTKPRKPLVPVVERPDPDELREAA